MKFGKRLQWLIDDSLPEWRDKFIDYKRLKKSLKLISLAQEECVCPHCAGTAIDRHQVCPALKGVDFIGLLNTEIDKMNTFFLEKEEEFVIRLQEMKGKFESLREACSGDLQANRDVVEIRKAIVNVHGEMVLLENYSALNYTGLVKIIKKYDKRTGGILRTPFIQSVLQEPFFATDIISKLVHDCEETLQSLFPRSSFADLRTANGSVNVNGKLNGFEQYDIFSSRVAAEMNIAGDDDVERIMKNTIAAWRILKEFHKGSSTYNLFSVPPFGYDEHDEAAQHCSSPVMLVC